VTDLNHKDISKFQEAFENGLDSFKFTTEDLLTLKVMIHSTAKVKVKEEHDLKVNRDFALKLARIYIGIGKDAF